MSLADLRDRRSRQAMRVADASRGARERELALYELLDAAVDEAYWREQMRLEALVEGLFACNRDICNRPVGDYVCALDTDHPGDCQPRTWEFGFGGGAELKQEIRE